MSHLELYNGMLRSVNNEVVLDANGKIPESKLPASVAGEDEANYAVVKSYAAIEAFRFISIINYYNNARLNKCTSSTGNSRVMGYTRQAYIANDASARIYSDNVIVGHEFVTTYGVPVYMGDNGLATIVEQTTSGDTRQRIGMQIDATTFLFQPQLDTLVA